jgi:hypothetical protein
MLETLRQQPDEAPEYTQSEQWRPEPGDGIEGVVVETYSFEGKYKDASGDFPTIPGWVLKVDGDDTHWSVAGLHGVLRQEMDKASAQPGDRVAVLYTGKRPTKDGSGEYHHYKLAIRRGNGAAPAKETAGKPVASVPAQSRGGGGSLQHEPISRPRRKPGQAAQVDDSEPPF